LLETSDGVFYGTTAYGGAGDKGAVYRFAFGCEVSVEVDSGARPPGSLVPVRVHLAHRRPVTVTVPWELRLIAADGHLVAKRTAAPRIFEPGDVVDRVVELRLPQDLKIGTYTLELAISGMAGTEGGTTTLRVAGAH
jgi:uncharacterized repeat protein (TIGR03803 family)